MQRRQQAPDQVGILVSNRLTHLGDEFRIGIGAGRRIHQEVFFERGFAHLSLPGWLNGPTLGRAPHKIETSIPRKCDKFQGKSGRTGVESRA